METAQSDTELIMNLHCRLCKQIKCDMESIFHTIHDSSKSLYYKIILFVCPTLTISKDDGLPSNICADCRAKLIDAYNFENMCVNSENEFRSMLPRDADIEFCQVPVFPEIKMEIPDEDEEANNELEGQSSFIKQELLFDESTENYDNQKDKIKRKIKCKCGNFVVVNKFKKHLKFHLDRRHFSVPEYDLEIKKYDEECNDEGTYEENPSTDDSRISRMECSLCGSIVSYSFYVRHMRIHYNRAEIDKEKYDEAFQEYKKMVTLEPVKRKEKEKDKKTKDKEPHDEDPGRMDCPKCRISVGRTYYRRHLMGHIEKGEMSVLEFNDAISMLMTDGSNAEKMKCTICYKLIKIATFGKHLDKHKGQGEKYDDLVRKYSDILLLREPTTSKIDIEENLDSSRNEKSESKTLKVVGQSQTVPLKSEPDVEVLIKTDAPNTHQLKVACVVCNKMISHSWYKQHLEMHLEKEEITPIDYTKAMDMLRSKRWEANATKERYSNVVNLTTDTKEIKLRFGDEQMPNVVKVQKASPGSEQSDKLKCSVCEKTVSITWYRRHLIAHKEKGEMLNTDIDFTIKYAQCKLCSKSFTSKANLRNHLFAIHNFHPEGAGKYQCKLCDKSFMTKGTLKIHVDKGHKHDQVKYLTHPECSFKCNKYDNMDDFVKHLMRVHDSMQPGPEEFYICDLCPTELKTLVEMRKHVVTHAARIGCPMCTKTFANSGSLKFHMNEHTGTPVSCEICNRLFKNPELYKYHVKEHTEVKDDVQHLCPLCGKAFKSKKGIRNHMETHQTNVYQCEHCPKKFNVFVNWQVHMRRHKADRKRYYCDSCEANYSTKKALTEHLRKHMNYFPYECEFCSKKFHRLDHYKAHINIHTKQKVYDCPCCDKQFLRSGDYFKHKRQHLGDKMYPCDKCPQTFMYFKELQDHLLQHFYMEKSQQEATTTYQHNL